MRPQDLLRLRTSWIVPGEGIGADGAVASRLQARNKEPRDVRTLIEASVERRGSKGRTVRNIRLTVEPGDPAPLLMRLMRKKSTLEGAARTKAVVREAREPRAERPRSREELAAARSERVAVVATNPVRGLLPERAVWGMAAARGVGVVEAT